MAMIRTRCPACRQHITFPADRCALLADADSGAGAYAFVCPECADPVVRPADERVEAMLVAGGASAHGVTERPGRPPHPERPQQGPPFTADDVLDLHFLLDNAGWFEHLRRDGA
jgi:hypothetical protein